MLKKQPNMKHVKPYTFFIKKTHEWTLIYVHIYRYIYIHIYSSVYIYITIYILYIYYVCVCVSSSFIAAEVPPCGCVTTSIIISGGTWTPSTAARTPRWSSLRTGKSSCAEVHSQRSHRRSSKPWDPGWSGLPSTHFFKEKGGEIHEKKIEKNGS